MYEYDNTQSPTKQKATTKQKMNDYLILYLYVFAISLNFAYVVVLDIKRSAGSLLALLVWCLVLYTVHVTEAKYPIDDVYFFPVLAMMYVICAICMKKMGDSAWIGSAVVSSYYFYFSYDCWMYDEVYTWTYTHHESIVVAAHTLVVLLLIKVRFTVVYSSTYLLWRNRCSRKDNHSD